MDLQEGKKKGNVWRLESEAFKKPIELKIWFETQELIEFQSKVDWLRDELNSKQYQLDKLKEGWGELADGCSKLWKMLYEQQMQLDDLKNKLEEERSERKELLKEIASLKTMVETHSGTILHLQEQVRLLEKKTTKQPSVFHDKSFISWREASGLWMFNLNDGDYLMVAKYVVWEHNEYVDNKDDIVFEKIHVEGQHYVPFYKLEWGTELDTPTATIYYDLIFIPI